MPKTSIGDYPAAGRGRAPFLIPPPWRRLALTPASPEGSRTNKIGLNQCFDNTCATAIIRAFRIFEIGRALYADCTRQGKRAFRSSDAPLQTHHRKNRSADRAARPRVLRKADFRAQAQARRSG